MTTALALPDEKSLVDAIKEINRFQQLVKANLIDGQDFGIIPGTDKPTLLKPGAEKIAKLLQLSDTYQIMDKSEDWDKPFFRYMIKATLIYIPTGVIISEGMGECNSYETKYRWRDSLQVCHTCRAEAIVKGKEEWGGGWLCFKKTGGCGAKFKDGDTTIESQ